MLSFFLNPEGRLRGGWKALLFFGAYSIVMSVLTAPVVILATARHLNFQSVLEGPLGAAIALVSVLMVTAAFLAIERRPFRTVGYHMNGRWVREALLGVGGGILIMTLTALLLLASGGFHWSRVPGLSWGHAALHVAQGFGLFILVAFHEETLFRGYPFQRLEESLGTWPTQLLLAVLFTLMHMGNPGLRAADAPLRFWSLLNIALAAIFLGLAYLRTRSLALPIGLHLGWNWAQGSLLGFQVSGTHLGAGPWFPVLHDKPHWFTGGSVGLEGSIFCTLVVAVGILALLAWEPKNKLIE